MRMVLVAGCGAMLGWLAVAATASHAQNAVHASAKTSFSPGSKFSEMSGEELFGSVCQGCHMPDGRGATGAGTYPSLQADRNLQAGGYPVSVVVNGQRAMPGFGAMMNDEQIVAVVNYLRTHFGNDYRDAVTIEDVWTVRR